MDLLRNGCLLLIGLGACLIILTIIYRLYFHPLARFPGPLLAKLTDLYSGYHAWKGDIHVDILRMHARYGDRVRYAPNRLLFNNAEAVSDIYGHRRNVTKSKAYNVLVHRAPNTFTMRDAKEHGRRRRVISQCLSETNVRAFEPTISSQIDNFIKCLAPSAGMEWSAVMNMSKWCDHHLFDLMTKIIFSASYNALQEDEYKEIMECLAESNVRMSALWNAPVLKSFRLDKYLFPKAIIARNVFIRFVGQMVNERSKKADCHDVFSRLWAHANLATEEALSPSQIVAESTTLIVAGSDTTSTALAATLFYLSTNSKAYQQVINEVRSTFGLKEEIKAGPKLSSCLYLRASIHEAMRLSPSAGGPLWREVKKDGIVIDGIFVPEGCDVGMGIYSIQHQASHFPDPFSYKPERWLKDISKSDIFNSAYMAFSTGPRGCVGKSLALLELSLTMANILWALDFESDFADISGGGFGCHPSEFFMRDHITAVHNGPFLKFRERQY